jgi:ribonuclease R
VGESTGQVYRLDDRVEVQVARVDLERRQIDFALTDVIERAAARRRRGIERPAPRGRASAGGPRGGRRPARAERPRAGGRGRAPRPSGRPRRRR